MKVFKLFSFCVLLLVPCFAQVQDELILRSGIALQKFVAVGQKKSVSSYEAMKQIFTATSLNYDHLRQAIRSDITMCRRLIRKHAKDSVEYRQLLDQLRSFYNYVKEHKECCKAICFHEKLRQRYQLAFNNLDIVQDVESTPELFGVEESQYKCRAYFNKIVADLRKIEMFEDSIHGDHGVLKAHNHVYKIELIKVRNHVYHNNIYKYETRHFKLR